MKKEKELWDRMEDLNKEFKDIKEQKKKKKKKKLKKCQDENIFCRGNFFVVTIY